MTYKIGWAKVDMTFDQLGYGMLGYGSYQQKITGVANKQFARAFIFEYQNRRIIFVNADFCFCTINLKYGVLQQLQKQDLGFVVEDAQLMITAQHSHSTAGGYDQHLIYNLSMPGFQQEIYEHYRDAIVTAILQASKKMQNSRIKLQTGMFDKDAPICFNRSIKAYNQNPEVEEKLSKKNRHLATDRSMKLLRIDAEDASSSASINWFGVHTTSLSNRNTLVSSDNKGFAAESMENYLSEQESSDNSVCIFAQDAAGDVSPNYIWQRRYREYRGPYKEELRNAQYNGEMQYQKAKEIYEEAGIASSYIQGTIDYAQLYVDMSSVLVDDQYSVQEIPCSTSKASMGIGFLAGTTDGQGAAPLAIKSIKLFLQSLKHMNLSAAKLSGDTGSLERIKQYYEAQSPKAIVMNLSTGIVAGARHPENLVIPDFVDPVVKFIKYANKVGYGKKRPWVTERLPLQIFLLGSLAIVGIPAEISTIAGQRIKRQLLKRLEHKGIQTILLSPYANAYSGYITTAEEYRVQTYEGAHTLFGQWTLAAYQSKFDQLCEILEKPTPKRAQSLPFLFEREDIWNGYS